MYHERVFVPPNGSTRLGVDTYPITYHIPLLLLHKLLLLLADILFLGKKGKE
jgi:hypothetical protein